MTSIGRVLKFFAFFAFASAQLLNIDEVDELLRQIHKDLKNVERKIASWMEREISELEKIVESISVAELKQKVKDLTKLYKNLKTVENFAPYHNLTTCHDINIKITTLETDVRRWVDLQLDLDFLIFKMILKI